MTLRNVEAKQKKKQNFAKVAQIVKEAYGVEIASEIFNSAKISDPETGEIITVEIRFAGVRPIVVLKQIFFDETIVINFSEISVERLKEALESMRAHIKKVKSVIDGIKDILTEKGWNVCYANYGKGKVGAERENTQVEVKWNFFDEVEVCFKTRVSLEQFRNIV